MSNIIYVGFSFLIICFFILLFGIIALKKKKNFKKVIFVSLLSFTISVILVYFCYQKFAIPQLKIKGDEIVTINVFDKYEDDGYVLNHPNKKLLNNVKILNEVNTEKPGIYDVIYSLKYMNKEISVKRKVIVKDEISPTIELFGDLVINKSIDSEYIEPGFKASDNVDGDITNKVNVINNIKDEVGKYEIIYEVEDTSGNKFSIKRQINVINDNNGVVYLTFDDGPSSSTTKILDILKAENIKATFFVVNYGSYYDEMVKRIVDDGHTIALHSYTHNYKLIYASEDAYFDDLYKLRERVKATTGIESNIIRFPGGSSNTISSFNKGIMSRLVKQVKERGFHYFDWNVDSSDAWNAKNKDDVYNNVIDGLRKNRNNVVLMHDLGHNVKTVEALPNIISTIKSKGYTFDKITYDTPMVVHGVNN